MSEESTTEEAPSTDLPQYLLGKKKEMTQVFTEDGSVHPATVVAAGPVVVTQVKTMENDGYQAYQFGYDSKKAKRTSKPEQGHMQAAQEASDKEADEYFAVLREYRMDDETELAASVGDSISVSDFAVGDVIDVSGTSKGKGFQGVVKRHGFSGGRRTHGGQKSAERGPGSIGATGPSRVIKGTRMAGRTGGASKTVQNLEIVHVDEEAGELYIRGGLPGPSGGLLEIRAAKSEAEN